MLDALLAPVVIRPPAVGLVRFRRGGLGGYSLRQGDGLVATFFNLGDQFPRLHVAEPLETEITDDGGEDAEWRQEDGYRRAPGDQFYAVELAPQLVKVRHR